jgi:hypothetical protein
LLRKAAAELPHSKPGVRSESSEQKNSRLEGGGK